MITEQHTQEALCRAYIIALAGSAGANYELGRGFDYGVDCTIRQVIHIPARRRRVESGFSIEIQLKSSTLWHFDVNGNVVYDLEAKTWNDLISREPAALPLYLGLLCLPKDKAQWLSSTEERLILKHCCYYFKPSGAGLSEAASSRRIHIPRQNVLTSNSIVELLENARSAALGGRR